MFSTCKTVLVGLCVIGVLPPTRAQTSDTATVCVTTEATASGAAAGSDCAVPFRWTENSTDLNWVATDDGSGTVVCPVAVDQRSRAPESEDYFAPATCTLVRCVTKETNATGIEAGTPCVFPFIGQMGVLRKSCVTDSPWGEDPWCPTAVDEDGDTEYKQWGYCDCSSASPTPPTIPPTRPPTNPQPTPPPPPTNPPPPTMAAPFAPADDADGAAIATGVGTTLATIFVIAVLVVAYRRGAFAGLRSDAQRDLGMPEGFSYTSKAGSNGESRSLFSFSNKIREQSYGAVTESPVFAYATLDTEGKDPVSPSIRPAAVPMVPAANSTPDTSTPMMTAADTISRAIATANDANRNWKQDRVPLITHYYASDQADAVPETPPPQKRVARMVLDSDKSPQLTPPAPPPITLSGAKPAAETIKLATVEDHSSAVNAAVDEIDWASMEAAAAKLRTCRVIKADGEKIGMRLLNYLGPNFAGVKVVGIHPDSPAAKAGVKEGDSIVEISNAPVINLYHQEVVELLSTAGNSFDIIVCRE